MAESSDTAMSSSPDTGQGPPDSAAAPPEPTVSTVPATGQGPPDSAAAPPELTVSTTSDSAAAPPDSAAAPPEPTVSTTPDSAAAPPDSAAPPSEPGQGPPDSSAPPEPTVSTVPATGQGPPDSAAAPPEPTISTTPDCAAAPPEPTVSTVPETGADITISPEADSTDATVPEVVDDVARPEVAPTVATTPDVGNTVAVLNTRYVVAVPEARDVAEVPEARYVAEVPALRDVVAVLEPRDALAVPEVRDVAEVPALRDVAEVPALRDVVAVLEPRDALAVPEVRDVVAAPESRCSAVEIPDIGQTVSQARSAALVAEEIAGDRRLGDAFHIANYTVYNTYNNCNVCMHNDVPRPNVPREHVGSFFPSESSAGCFPSESNSENVRREDDGESLLSVFANEASDTSDAQDATRATPAGVVADTDGAKQPENTDDDTEMSGKDTHIMDNKASEYKAEIAAKDKLDKVSMGKPEIKLAATFAADQAFKTDLCTQSVKRDKLKRLPKDTKKKAVGAKTTRKTQKDKTERRGARTSRDDAPKRKEAHKPRNASPERRGVRDRPPERRQAVIDYFRELNMGVQESPKRIKNDKKDGDKPSRLPRPVTKTDPKKVIAEMMETLKPTTKTQKPTSRKIPVLIREKKSPVSANTPETESSRRPANKTAKTPRRPVPQKYMAADMRYAPATQDQKRVAQSLREAIWSDKPKKFLNSGNRLVPTKPGVSSKTNSTIPTTIETQKQPTHETPRNAKCNEPSTDRQPPTPRVQSPDQGDIPGPGRISENEHYKKVIVNLKAAQDVYDLVDIAKAELDLMVFEIIEAACEEGASNEDLDIMLDALVNEYNNEMSNQIIIQVMKFPDKFHFGSWNLRRDTFRMSPPLPYLNEGAIPGLHVKYPNVKVIDNVHIPHPPETKKDNTTYNRKIGVKEKKESLFNKVKSFVVDKLGIGNGSSSGPKENIGDPKMVKNETIPAKAEKFELIFSPPSTPAEKPKPNLNNKFVRFDIENDNTKCEKKSSAQAWEISFDDSTTAQKSAPPTKSIAKTNKNTKKPATTGKKTTYLKKKKPMVKLKVKKVTKVTCDKKVEEKRTTRAVECGKYAIPDTDAAPPPARELGRTPLPPIASSRTGSRVANTTGENGDLKSDVATPDYPVINADKNTSFSIDVKSGRMSSMAARLSPLKTEVAPLKKKPTAIQISPRRPTKKYAQYSAYDADDKAPIPKAPTREIARTPLPPINSDRTDSPQPIRKSGFPAQAFNLPRAQSPAIKIGARLPMIAPGRKCENYLKEKDVMLAEMGVPEALEPLPPIGESRLSPQMGNRVHDCSMLNEDNSNYVDSKTKGRMKRKSDAGASAVGIPIAPVMVRRSKA